MTRARYGRGSRREQYCKQLSPLHPWCSVVGLFLVLVAKLSQKFSVSPTSILERIIMVR
jgi:hypothetical protein